VTIIFKYGLGKHQYNLYILDELVPISRQGWFSVLPELISEIFGGISIYILLVRLFGGVHKWFKYCALLLTACGVIMSILICVSIYASRKPIESLWDPFILSTGWKSNVVQDMMYLGQGKSDASPQALL